jgi:hypothetical protein
MKFIRAVVNMSYSNLHDFKEFGEDATLQNTDLEDLIKQVTQYCFGSLAIRGCLCAWSTLG